MPLQAVPRGAHGGRAGCGEGEDAAADAEVEGVLGRAGEGEVGEGGQEAGREDSA